MIKRFRQILGRLAGTQAAWPVVGAVTLLCVVGVLALHVTYVAGGVDRGGLQEHHLMLGVGLLVVLLLPHYEWFGRVSFVLLGVVCVLLVGAFFTVPVNGARRWFSLPYDIQLQPSELAKIAYVLALAWYLRYRKDVRTWGGLVVPFVLTLVPFGLIVFEPDLGTALLFPMVLYAMLLAAGARVRHLLLILVAAGVVLPSFYPVLQPYQKQRIVTVLTKVMGQRSAHARMGADYQQETSQMLIGSGGWTGQGADGADMIRHGILPEAYTDFIFAVVGNQYGFVGCGLVVVLYLVFLGGALEIAGAVKDPFAGLVTVGLGTMILAQAFINMAMTLGMGPVVGIALPFVSYGGSSLVTNLAATGVLLNLALRRGK